MENFDKFGIEMENLDKSRVEIENLGEWGGQMHNLVEGVKENPGYSWVPKGHIVKWRLYLFCNVCRYSFWVFQELIFKFAYFKLMY